MRKIVPYSKARPDLQTFDILNCHPHGLFWDWIDHTAFVYRTPEQVMVYESTQRKYAGKSGVRLTPMADWLHNYPGKVEWRSVTITVDWRRFVAEERAKDHIYKYRGTPYPDLKTRAGRWFLANARLDLPFDNPWKNKDTDKMFFCTMLGGHWFRYCGLTLDFNPAELDTKDMHFGGKFEKYLVDGVKIGEGKWLK